MTAFDESDISTSGEQESTSDLGELPLDASLFTKISAPCDQLMAALSAAGGELHNPLKGLQRSILNPATGDITTFQYADLPSLFDLLRPVLAKHGLALCQQITAVDEHLGVVTILGHKSGQRLESFFRVPVAIPKLGDDSFRTMSAIATFARRLAITAAFPIAATDEPVREETLKGRAAANPRRSNAAPPARSKAATKKATRPVYPAQRWFIGRCSIAKVEIGAERFAAILAQHGFETPEAVEDQKTAKAIAAEFDAALAGIKAHAGSSEPAPESGDPE